MPTNSAWSMSVQSWDYYTLWVAMFELYICYLLLDKHSHLIMENKDFWVLPLTFHSVNKLVEKKPWCKETPSIPQKKRPANLHDGYSETFWWNCHSHQFAYQMTMKPFHVINNETIETGEKTFLNIPSRNCSMWVIIHMMYKLKAGNFLKVNWLKSRWTIQFLWLFKKIKLMKEI